MEEISLQDILAIFSRQRKYFIITCLALFAVSLAVMSFWSNYRSTATVQIEQSSITENVINPNEPIVELADQRINQIQQKVTSLESLAEIIKKFHLYPGNTHTPISVLTDKMRNKIKMELISGSLSNPIAAQKQTAEQLSAIAFNLSFDYSDPKLAQQVTNELVKRFMDEDMKMRRTRAEETSSFLGAQISALEGTMAEQEKTIADFRSKHGESGPAALMFNQQTAASLTMSIQNVESQIAANEGTQGNLKAQLATVSPYSRVIENGQLLTTPEVQLKALETQYAALTSQYGPDHPDVVKARHQIAALKAQIGPHKTEEVDNSAQIEAQIADVRTNLAAAKKNLGPDHPDVVALERQLTGLEKAKEAASGHSHDAMNLAIKRDADNPAYLQLVAQLMTAEEQHKSLEEQHEELLVQKTKYEKAIALDPDVEKEMDKLSRDYENSQLRYRELKEKKMIADINVQLEVGRKGQRLLVTNPPEVPNDTHPSHWLLLLGGLIVSLVGGTGSVFLAEFLNQNVHGAEHLSQLLGALPLVTIPHLASEGEKTVGGWLIRQIHFLRPHALALYGAIRHWILRRQETV